MREASLLDLAAVPGIPEPVARAVYDYFRATPVA
jgi:hypothetical protein